jgi:hypothetical protein
MVMREALRTAPDSTPFAQALRLRTETGILAVGITWITLAGRNPSAFAEPILYIEQA